MWPRRYPGRAAVFQFGICSRGGCSGPATL